MVGGRTAPASRRRSHAASVVVPFPRGAGGNRLDVARLVPSGRSLLVGFGLVLGVLLAYWGARASSVFAVDRVQVRGAPPGLTRQVESATRQYLGLSLLAVDAAEVSERVNALPLVAGVSVDRAFPNTLVVKVAPEMGVAVVRIGHSAWLATGGGDVLREIRLGTRRSLPRLWLTRDVPVQVGGTLPAVLVPATRALAAVRAVGLRHRVKAVRLGEGQLTLVFRHGPEIRLGGPTDLRLKLAVAARIFPLLAPGTVYVDVSVPERPVASTYLNP